MIVAGLLSFSQAQEPGAKPPQAKDKKDKLFDVPAVGGKGKAQSGGILDALRDKNVQEEVGLIPAQVEELEALSAKAASELNGWAQRLKSLPKDEQAAQLDTYRKDLAAYMQRLQADVYKILVPEQQQRLRQVVMQLSIQKAGPSAALTSPEVLRQLHLNEAQAQELRERLLRVEEENRQRRAQLLAELEVRNEARILAQFTPAQQEKLKSLIGDIMAKNPGAPGGDKPKKDP